MIGALFLGNHDDNAPHLGPKPPPANKMEPPSKPPVQKPAVQPTASTSQNAEVSATAADSAKIVPSTPNTTSTSTALDGFVDVAASSAVAQDDSRLLVQVFDEPLESSSTTTPQQPAPPGLTASAPEAAGTRGSGRWVALVRHSGTLTAMDATCYHMGGPLLMADIEDVATTTSGGSSQPGCKKDAALVCPWHHYRIRLSDGRRLHLASGKGSGASSETYEASGEVRQRVHEVQEANGRVWVKLLDGRADGSAAASDDAAADSAGNNGNDAASTRGPKEVMSDEYAFKKPMPASRSGGQRSGAVLQRLREQGGGKGSGAGSASALPGHTASGKQRLLPAVEEAVGASMRGGDGVAPWALAKANSSSSSSSNGSALSSTKAGAWRAPVPQFNAPRPPGTGAGAVAATTIKDDASSSSSSSPSSSALPLPSLSPSEFKLFTCTAAVPAGRGMVRLTFRGYFFAGSDRFSLLGAFGSGAHVDVCAEVPSLREPHTMEEQVRPYTPIARPAAAEGAVTSAQPSCGAMGPESFDLLVKSYPRGRVSRALVTTQPGQQVAMRGPMGGLPPNWLLGNPPQGKASSSSSSSSGGSASDGSSASGGGKRVHLVVVGAGTGITPALQLVYAARAAAHGSLSSVAVEASGSNTSSIDGDSSALNAPLNAMAEGSEEEDEEDDNVNVSGTAAMEEQPASTSNSSSIPQKQQSSSVAAVTVIACNHAAVDIPLAAELTALDNWSAQAGVESSPSTFSSSFSPHAAAPALRVRVRHLLSSAETEPGNRVSPPVPGLLGRGRIAAEVLAPLLATGGCGDNEEDWEVRLAWCGPEGFGEAMRRAATQLRVNPVHCHEFG